MSEDRHLNQSDRRKLIAGVRSLRRNFSVAAWMIRRHLDYVSSFRFQPRTGDDDVDRQLEWLVKRDSKPERAHSRGRFSLARMLRVAELLRTVDGDCGWLRLASGHVQLIEGDRIRDPLGIAGFNRAEWRNGVRVDGYGRPLEYAVHGRVNAGSGFQFERTIPAANMLLHGYYDREDQTRGVSPLASAYNELQDAYEFHDFTRARAKIQSLFGLKFTRDSEFTAGSLTEDTADSESGGSGTGAPRYSVDFGRGIFQLELDPGDDASFIESGHPSSQLQQYVESILILALKSVDLPMSFLREDFTNFFGSRGAWLMYDRACEAKREDNREVLDSWTRWKMAGWILRGDLVLPAGVTLDSEPWEWIPRKVPAFKRIEDIRADILALEAGLTTAEGICREDDENTFRQNVKDNAAAKEYARSLGFKVSWDLSEDDETTDSADADETPAKAKAKGKDQ